MGSTRSSAGVSVDGPARAWLDPRDRPRSSATSLGQDSEVGPALEDPLCLGEGRGGPRRIRDGEIRPRDLELRDDRRRWQRVRRKRPHELRVHQLRPTARHVTVTDGHARRDRVHQHRRCDRLDVHLPEPVVGLARIPSRRVPLAPGHRETGPESEGVERVAAPARCRIDRVGEHRICRGRVSAHDVAQREDLAGEGTPRASRPLGGDRERRICDRAVGTVADHARPQHRSCRLEGRRPVRGHSGEGGTFDDVRQVIGRLGPAAEGMEERRPDREARPARERRVVEGPEPPVEPVAVALEVGPLRRLFDEEGRGVDVAARDRMLDRELRAPGRRVPGRRPAVERGLGVRLPTLQLGAQVVAQEVVVAVRGRATGDLADEQVRAHEPPQALRRVGHPGDDLGQPRLDGVEDRRPREEGDVPVVERRSQLGVEVVRDVALATGHGIRLGRADPVAATRERGEVDRGRPSFGPIGERPRLVAPQRVPGAGGEGRGLIRVEGELVASDLEQLPPGPEPPEGEVGRRPRGHRHLEPGRQEVEERRERVEARPIDEVVEVVEDEHARASSPVQLGRQARHGRRERA